MGLLLNLKKKFTLVGISLLGMNFNGWRNALISASEVQQKQAIVRLRVEPTESPKTAFFEQSFLDNGLQLPTTGVDRLYFMLGFGFLLMLWLFWLARQIQFLSTRKE
ncbi:hypothetical protein ACJQWY_05840 [Weissella kandleri]|uniref:hypothetical protein n=1 Tax=Weissella kandleri TaxID=1616 RepID=UPI00387EBD9E